MVVEVQSLLEPVSAERPCGEDLSRDPAFVELEDSVRSQAKPGMVPGESGQSGEETDWEKVLSQAVELLRRTKDLRLAGCLVVGAVQREGLAGLQSSLALVDGMLEKYWEALHPQLSAEDGFDPQIRLSALAFLSTQAYGDPLRLFSRLRDVPLCGAPGKGRFSLRDLQTATGELPPPRTDKADTEAPVADTSPTLATIQTAFRQTPLAELQARLEAARKSEALVEKIEGRLDKAVGAGKALSFRELRKLLQQMSGHLASAMPGGAPLPGEAAQAGAADGSAPSLGGASTAGAAADGEVRSPQDVVRLLEKVCQYYARHEPSSPIPLLVRRAQRLVSKDFLDIIRDLTPGSMQQIEVIGGLDKPATQE